VIFSASSTPADQNKCHFCGKNFSGAADSCTCDGRHCKFVPRDQCQFSTNADEEDEGSSDKKA
jgi:hypothetical protein